jgi:hypothetical protein
MPGCKKISPNIVFESGMILHIIIAHLNKQIEDLTRSKYLGFNPQFQYFIPAYAGHTFLRPHFQSTTMFSSTNIKLYYVTLTDMV